MAVFVTGDLHGGLDIQKLRDWAERPYEEWHGGMVQHGFEDLGMGTIWRAYYEGNQKSKRVQ